MQTWIEDIVDWLDAASTSLKAGTNLFADVMPAEANTVALTVFEMPGSAPDGTYGGDAWQRPAIQVVSRSTAPRDIADVPDHTGARREIWTAYRRLSAVGNTALSTRSPGRLFGAVAPTEAPAPYDIDEMGRVRYSFTAQVWVTPTTGVS
jgi:hypothetical protein